MKVFTTILKVLAALAAIAGVVYVVATYGDKIVAWAKKALGMECCCDCDCCCDEEDCDCECCCQGADEADETVEEDFEEEAE